jgi:DNA-binding SARP family transcriptional activator/predicted ATPase
MSHLEIRLLGPIQVHLDGQPIAHLAGTSQALLAYLATHAGTPHLRTSLAGLLWSDYDQSSALTNLRQALRRLRMAIGDRHASPPFLLVTRTTIALDPESDYWLDVDAFTAALEAVRSHAHPSVETCATCAERLTEAVALCRGEFLDGLALDSALFEEWMVVERERLHGQMLEALGHLAAYREAQGAYEEAMYYARRALELEPWREEAHRALMRALALGGQRSAALAQYEACRDVLREELGVEPAEATSALYERIRDGEVLPGTRSRPPSVPSEIGSLHNLPAQLTPFIGRGRELAEIAERLADPNCRLLTLVGPGGSGKTRLALEAAARELMHYPHGVFFVSLAPLQSAEAIVPAVAQAIGLSVHGGGDAKRQLLYYLRDKQVLLLIDNIEHLLASPAEKEGRRGGGGEILLEVLRAAAGVRLLVTSRIRLSASGEQVLAVPGMDYPAQELAAFPPDSYRQPVRSILGYSAVQLYLQQARHVRPDYGPAEEAVAQIGRICRLVGGMPLAILLAAAWMDVLSPEEIGAELEKSIAFLQGNLSDLPERHHSMVAAFDVSWSLLSEAERDAFAALSVFRGGCMREAAQAVAGADLEILRALSRKSFLTRDEHGHYQVHELLRQYAEEKLRQKPGAWEGACDRHCAFYAQYVGEREESFCKLGPGEARLEIDNLHAAWRWMLDRGKVAECRRVIGGLYLLDVTWSKMDVTLALLLEGVVTLLRRAEPTRENRVALGMALCYLSMELMMTEEHDRGAALAREGHQILTELDARRELTEAKIVAYLAGMAEDDAEADRLLQDSLSLARETGRPEMEARALEHVGSLYFVRAMVGGGPQGDAWRRAQAAYAAALEVYRRIGSRLGEANLLTDQAICAHAQGRYVEARSLHRGSRALFRRLGAQWWALFSLRRLGDVALTASAPQEAQAYYQALLDESQAGGLPIETRYALCGLGDVALAKGKAHEAARLYRRAIQGAMEDWKFDGRERTMLSLAKWSAQRGERARAAELLALAYHIVATHAPWCWSEVGLAGGRELEQALQEALSPEAYAAAQERGRARDMKETLRELLAELEAELAGETEGPQDRETEPGQ